MAVALRFAGGALGSVLLARSTTYGEDVRTEVLATNGSVWIGGIPTTPGASSGGLPRAAGGPWTGALATDTLDPSIPRFERGYADQTRGFVEAIVADRPVAVPASESRAALRIAVAADRSMHEGRPVAVARRVTGLQGGLVPLGAGAYRAVIGRKDPAMDVATDTPLARMTRTTPTEYWNDSSAVAELEYAIANGAVGATSNPTIVGEVLRKELDAWRPRIRELSEERPTATDVEITWAVAEAMAVRGAALLEPIFVRERGRKGRLSIQTNPTFHRDAERMLDQGRRFAGAGAEHPGQVPGDERRARGDRGGHLRRHLDQRDRVVHPAAGPRGRRRRRARPGPPRGRRPGRGRDEPGLHPDDRPARRLGEGGLRARRHRGRPGRPELGGDRRVQACGAGSTPSGATGPDSWRRPTAIASTGPSSSAATSP